MVTNANDEGDPGITLYDQSFRPQIPVVGVSWNAAACYAPSLEVYIRFSLGKASPTMLGAPLWSFIILEWQPSYWPL